MLKKVPLSIFKCLFVKKSVTNIKVNAKTAMFLPYGNLNKT